MAEFTSSGALLEQRIRARFEKEGRGATLRYHQLRRPKGGKERFFERTSQMSLLGTLLPSASPMPLETSRSCNVPSEYAAFLKAEIDLSRSSTLLIVTFPVLSPVYRSALKHFDTLNVCAPTYAEASRCGGLCLVGGLHFASRLREFAGHDHLVEVCSVGPGYNQRSSAQLAITSALVG